jgi:hypothetical protein
MVRQKLFSIPQKDQTPDKHADKKNALFEDSSGVLSGATH